MAALTSTISLHEVVTAYIHEEFRMTRKKAAWFVSAGVLFLGILSSLSYGLLKEFTIGGLIFFDMLDYLTAKIMLPLGGMLTCIFVGTRVDQEDPESRADQRGDDQVPPLLHLCLLHEIRLPDRHRHRIPERARPPRPTKETILK